jgi:hypothetical protein
MKARIKGTNTIVECIRIDGFFGEKGKGVYCQYINGEHPGAYETIPGDCLIELENDFNWRSFRAEAAKDILCSMINHFGTSNIDMNDVVKWTDSLISKLKEKEVRNE